MNFKGILQKALSVSINQWCDLSGYILDMKSYANLDTRYDIHIAVDDIKFHNTSYNMFDELITITTDIEGNRNE